MRVILFEVEGVVFVPGFMLGARDEHGVFGVLL